MLSLFWMTALAMTAPDHSGEFEYSRFVELRVYRMHTGRQQAFIDHFETHYLESQEAHGMWIFGQFRVLDDDRSVVWIRGYRSMAEREQGLTGFYTSELWRRTSHRVSALMAERATHVYLLEPLAGRSLRQHERAEEAPGDGIVLAAVYPQDCDGVPERVEQGLVPALEAAGVTVHGLLRSSEEPNNFPPLPVIEDRRVLVLVLSTTSPDHAESLLGQAGCEPLETYRLAPGKRSRLAHGR